MAQHIIAFQGKPGAYSDLACRKVKPGWKTLPCHSFAETIQAVHEGRAELAMLACENSLVGRVPDIHLLLPDAGLFIVGEHFERIEHCLLGVPQAEFEQVKRVHTHAVAMDQIRTLIRTHHFTPVVEFDTAGAAELVAQWNNPEDAAVASDLAAELYGLKILRHHVEDSADNVTRFYIASRTAERPSPETPQVMTTLVFSIENKAGSLYKVLGGFAVHGVNMTRLESYMSGGNFAATRFLMDVEGHPESFALGKALSELRAFTQEITILGVYVPSPFRHHITTKG